MLCASVAWAMPSSITYQGSLKEQGAPVNGTRQMVFRLTNSDGQTVYWTSTSIPVSIAQGLFAVILNPAGVDWQSISPFLEISVEGQVLLPREPITAGAYALMSQTVPDGAITAPKLEPGVQALLVPSGMIALFAGSCPSGWVRFTALDNVFPLGGAAYGATGGSATHSHAITADGAHNHGGATGTANLFNRQTQSCGGTIPHMFLDAVGDPNLGCGWDDHNHAITSEGNHNHGGATSTVSHLPPYLTMVYCQKQ